jgi:GNAT superfamily N-acetyltransferase
VRRDLGDGYELDDDRARIDVGAVHAFLETAYWAEGRPRTVVADTVASAARVVGLYCDGAQIGFARAISDRQTTAYLADVYVLEAHRGRSHGLALARFMVDEGPLAGLRWILHTRDMHRLYARLGFRPASPRVMER